VGAAATGEAATVSDDVGDGLGIGTAFQAVCGFVKAKAGSV
jgi:hypothetical protein